MSSTEIKNTHVIETWLELGVRVASKTSTALLAYPFNTNDYHMY
jgi:hypothetical protein